MENNGKAKKVIGRNLRFNLLLFSCLALGCYGLFATNKFFLRDFERGYSVTGNKYIFGIFVVNFFLILFTFLIPYFVLKLYPKIYYYDEGFRVGKNGEFIYYEKMDYFFTPAYNKVKSFVEIKYTNNEGEWKHIVAVGYPRTGFDLFQQDFVNINYPKAMKCLENGEKIEFLFNDPKAKLTSFGMKKFMKKKLDQAMKIIVTRESITFDNEVYEWDKYKIFVNLGNIIVQEEDGTNILSLGAHALIHRPNLLEALIETLRKN